VARFRPFRGLRYDSDKVGKLDAVVAPPYDVISVEERDALYDAGEYNSTRLILNREGHAEAAKLYRGWQETGALQRDGEPCFYLYSQEFEVEGPKRRTGVIGALHLEPFSTGVVRPHEQTFSHHKADRLSLTSEVKANLSPIFGLYSNADFHPEPDNGWDSEADIDVTFAGVRSRVWVIRDPARTAEISAAVDGRTVFIADGHHRYETALNYFGVARPDAALDTEGAGPSDDEEPAAHVMAFLGAFEDPGMLILPTHRQVEKSGGADWSGYVASLEAQFKVTRLSLDAKGRAAMQKALDDAPVELNAFGLAIAASKELFLIEKPAAVRTKGDSPLASLDVTVLHSTLLDDLLAAAGAPKPEISYSADTDAVLDRVASGDLEAVFVMRATLSDQLADVCMAGDLMPQKSTYFFPKLLTGLVFHSLDR
jgi:uncharacterized protein (DUF1015 family)